MTDTRTVAGGAAAQSQQAGWTRLKDTLQQALPAAAEVLCQPRGATGMTPDA